jgi:hypothetical protein
VGCCFIFWLRLLLLGEFALKQERRNV